MRRRAITAATVLLAGGIILTTMLGRATPRGDVPADLSRDTTADASAVHTFWETYREATSLRIAGRMAEARDAYRRALALNARHEDALYQLGNVSLELGDDVQAELAWTQLAEINHQSSRAHSRLGDLFACSDRGPSRDLARAEREYRQAAELNREETGPLLRLAELALTRGDLTDAQSSLNAVLGSHRSSAEARALSGYVAWKQGQGALALERFREAVAVTDSLTSQNHRSGEGDTRQGMTPQLASTTRCRSLPEQLEWPSGIDDGHLDMRMQPFFQQLERLLGKPGAGPRS